MLHVILKCLREYENVIDVCENEIPAIHTQNDVNSMLKVSWGVFQAERHSKILPEAIFSYERSEFLTSFG